MPGYSIFKAQEKFKDKVVGSGAYIPHIDKEKKYIDLKKNEEYYQTHPRTENFCLTLKESFAEHKKRVYSQSPST
jgi:MarR-like DNA-binding transcriptional regulator SgrR of sgrS sRNA